MTLCSPSFPFVEALPPSVSSLFYSVHFLGTLGCLSDCFGLPFWLFCPFLKLSFDCLFLLALFYFVLFSFQDFVLSFFFSYLHVLSGPFLQLQSLLLILMPYLPRTLACASSLLKNFLYLLSNIRLICTFEIRSI